MTITIKLMTISLVSILVLEISLLFNANKLPTYISNVSSVVLMPLVEMKEFDGH